MVRARIAIVALLAVVVAGIAATLPRRSRADSSVEHEAPTARGGENESGVTSKGADEGEFARWQYERGEARLAVHRRTALAGITFMAGLLYVAIGARATNNGMAIPEVFFVIGIVLMAFTWIATDPPALPRSQTAAVGLREELAGRCARAAYLASSVAVVTAAFAVTWPFGLIGSLNDVSTSLQGLDWRLYLAIAGVTLTVCFLAWKWQKRLSVVSR